jgi:hypothetical protein
MSDAVPFSSTHHNTPKEKETQKKEGTKKSRGKKEEESLSWVPHFGVEEKMKVKE